MLVVALWLASMAAFFAAMLLLNFVLERRNALPSPPDETYEAAAGGWRIALARYKPGAGVPARPPVLLCHGLLSNRLSLDLDGEVSLARYLRDAGFDVWLMELRAHGASRRDPDSDGPRSPLRAYDWTIDAYVREDLPAAIRRVLQVTGSPSLHFVGHSLGGMILYAHCAEGGTDWFRSAVAIDAPGYFAPMKFPTFPARLYAWIVPVVPVAFFKPLAHFLYAVVPGNFLRTNFLLDRKRLVKILYNTMIDVGSSKVLLHLCRCLSAGKFRSFDGSVDWEEGPARIEFPLLVLRAELGRAPEPCVRHAFDSAPAADKRYVKLAKSEGFSMDHNHVTPVLGRAAPREVFPLIAAWLLDHSEG